LMCCDASTIHCSFLRNPQKRKDRRSLYSSRRKGGRDSWPWSEGTSCIC